MRVFTAALCCVFSNQAVGQIAYTIDTNLIPGNGCHQKTIPYWYLKAKYPESSRRLAQMADASVANNTRDSLSTGFINFQFTVNCEGVKSAFHLTQTDQHYLPIQFSKEMVQALYLFLTNMKSWKPALLDGEPVYYQAYLAFKIKNGHVVEVSP